MYANTKAKVVFLSISDNASNLKVNTAVFEIIFMKSITMKKLSYTIKPQSFKWNKLLKKLTQVDIIIMYRGKIRIDSKLALTIRGVV